MLSIYKLSARFSLSAAKSFKQTLRVSSELTKESFRRVMKIIGVIVTIIDIITIIY